MGIFCNAVLTTFVWFLIEIQITYPETITSSPDYARYPMYLVVFFGSILTGSMILGLFDEAIMAMLHCVAIDMELNDGIP
jgi:hypothetical protein